jgi:endonuclease/exonuclease/phosphatase family metal-dependent hydrolase
VRVRGLRAAAALAACLAACVAAPAGAGSRAPAPDTLTVVTLNLWHDQRDWPRRMALIVAELRRRRPDVVCLQEVLEHERLPNQARTLGDSLGMSAHFTSVDPLGAPKRYGNAILTRLPVLATAERALAPRDDYRTAAHVRVALGGLAIDVYDTHLHHTTEGASIRAAQVADLLDFIGATRGAGPLVLAGDFNAEPGAPELAPVLARFVDAWMACGARARADTVSTLNPAHGHISSRIDHVFIARDGAPRLAPAACERLFDTPAPDGTWASDHFGVLVRLRMRRP